MGRRHPDLDGPRMPQTLAHVWGWFLELSAARRTGFSGVAAIGWADIDAWARLTGSRPRPWEVQLIRRLDDVFRQVTSEKEIGSDG